MPKPFLAVLTTALLLVGVTACGSSSGGSSSSAPPVQSVKASVPTAPAPKGAPIVVGTICSCTGPLAASLGKSLDIVKAWGQYTNANGGLNGHPVKIVAVDDAQNPAKGLAAAKQLVETDKVQAIVGQMSLTSGVWQKYVSQKGVPVVGGQSSDTTFITNPDFFPSGATLPVLLYGELAAAKQAGKKTVGVYYCAETPLCASIVPILQGLGKSFGLKVVGAKVSSTAPSYTAPCLSFKSQGVDALFVAVNSDVVPRIVKACNQQGFKPLNIASDDTTQRSWLSDDALEGSAVVGTNALYTDNAVPGVRTFNAAVQKYLPDLASSPQFSAPLLFPWVGGQLFAAAAKAGKLTPTSTPADVKTALYALKGDTLDGLAPPLTYQQGKPGFPACYFPAKLAGGSFSSTGGPVCLDAKTAAGIAAALGA